MAEVYDVIVIGGGPAGYSAALQSASLKGKTALVEAGALGGTCLNRGCIPTKYYLKTAEIIHHMSQAQRRGIMVSPADISMDMIKAVEDKQRVVRRLTGGVKSLLKQRGVDVITGRASALGNGRVAVEEGPELKGRAVILAGGSRPGKLPIPGADLPGVLTSDEILDIREVPSRLAILGGGVIGIEMAMIFSAFGAQVDVIELEERILPFMDPEVSRTMAGILGKRGIRIHTGTRCEGISKTDKGLQVHMPGSLGLAADTVLVAAGRQPDLSCVEPGLVDTDHGRIKTDEFMETSSRGIYAPGDINGRSMLAHSAFHMGTRAARNALGDRRPVDLRFVPSVVYGMPEAAGVGMTLPEASRGYETLSGVFPLAANGRSAASGDTQGYVQIVSEKRYGQILGVHIVGQGASEIINEASALMAMEITIHELSECIHAHPTVSEALAEAAGVILGTSVHL